MHHVQRDNKKETNAWERWNNQLKHQCSIPYLFKLLQINKGEKNSKLCTQTNNFAFKSLKRKMKFADCFYIFSSHLCKLQSHHRRPFISIYVDLIKMEILRQKNTQSPPTSSSSDQTQETKYIMEWSIHQKLCSLL